MNIFCVLFSYFVIQLIFDKSHMFVWFVLNTFVKKCEVLSEKKNQGNFAKFYFILIVLLNKRLTCIYMCMMYIELLT